MLGDNFHGVLLLFVLFGHQDLETIADGFGFHVPKGYIYAAMAFSAFVEFLNLVSRKRKVRKAAEEPPVH